MPDALSQARAALPGCWLRLTEFRGGAPVNASKQRGATIKHGSSEYLGSGDTFDEAILDALAKAIATRAAEGAPSHQS
jgi:hypothetical protein